MLVTTASGANPLRYSAERAMTRGSEENMPEISLPKKKERLNVMMPITMPMLIPV